MDYQRFYISRSEFMQAMGYEPSPDSIGVVITNGDRTAVLAEYIFTDEPEPEFVQPAEIAELERIYALSDPRPCRSL
jgi:hypothetical protein